MHRTTSITLLLTRLNCIEPHLKFRRATEAFDKTMLFITAVYESCPAVMLLMSATQATVTSMQVAVRYQRNVSSLSIDMSTDTRLIYRSRSVGQHINQHIARDISRHISIDISAESRSICRPKYRSSISQYVDQHIGRRVHKLHIIQCLHAPSFPASLFSACSKMKFDIPDNDNFTSIQ